MAKASEPFNPPVNLRTGQISAKLCGMAILRPLSDGRYIGFRSAGDAYGHPSTPRQPGQPA